MLTRLLGQVTLALVLSLSSLGIVFGADKDTQGFLGVVPGEVTSDIAAEYGVRSGEGVLVSGVSPESPAAKAGLRENDIIISLNNSSITGPEEFRNRIAKMNAGDKADLVYVRGGKQKSVSVELTDRGDREFGFWGPETMREQIRRERHDAPRAPRPPRAPRERREARAPQAEKVAFAGIVAQDLSEGLAKYFRVERGALIAEVVENSPAADAGLRAGDVILRIGDDNIENERDVRTAVRDRKKGDRVDFVVVRDGLEQVFTVTLGEQESFDLGEFDFNFDLPDLSGLDNLRLMVPDEEQMRELEQKLKEMEFKFENLDPMDIHIEQLPDNPRIHIERYRIGPVRNDEYGWQRSWRMVKNRFKTEFEELKADFARLRDEFIELGHELMGRTA